MDAFSHQMMFIYLGVLVFYAFDVENGKKLLIEKKVASCGG